MRFYKSTNTTPLTGLSIECYFNVALRGRVKLLVLQTALISSTNIVVDGVQKLYASVDYGLMGGFSYGFITHGPGTLQGETGVQVFFGDFDFPIDGVVSNVNAEIQFPDWFAPDASNTFAILGVIDD